MCLSCLRLTELLGFNSWSFSSNVIFSYSFWRVWFLIENLCVSFLCRRWARWKALLTSLGGNSPHSLCPATTRQSVKESQLRTQDPQEGGAFCSFVLLALCCCLALFHSCLVQRPLQRPLLNQSAIGQKGSHKDAVLLSLCLLVSHSGSFQFSFLEHP